MTEAVFFDFDGTLTDRTGSVYDTYDAFLKPYKLKLNDSEYEALLQDLMIADCNGTYPLEVRMQPFLRKYTDLLTADFLAAFSAFFYAEVPEHTVLKEDTIEVLEALKGRYKLGIISNGDSSLQHRKIAKVGIAAYFDTIVVSGDLGINKPDERIFYQAAENLGCRCLESLMIGDVFSTDILGAARAGMKTVWICSDPEKRSAYYQGCRIGRLSEVLKILEKENEDTAL